MVPGMRTRSEFQTSNPAQQAVLDSLPVAVYGRFSDEKGTIDTVANQKEGGAHYVGLTWEGRAIVDYGDDGISASDDRVERSDFNRLRADVRAGRVGAVVAKTQSRLTRNLPEWAKLRRDCLAAGIGEWHCWGKGGVVDIRKGQALKSKLDLMVDSDYGEVVSLNVMNGQASLARQGKPSGGVCFGYMRGPKPTKGGAPLIPDPETKDIPQEIFERYLAGETITAIAEDLTRREVPTARGRAVWRQSTVRALLRAPTLTGLRVYQAQIVGEGDWDAIVDRETWDKVQARLAAAGTVERRDGRKVTRGPRASSPTRYLLSGIARCSHCDDMTLTGSVRAGRSPMYLCAKSRGGCDRTSVQVAGVDAVVTVRLLNKMGDKRFRRYLAAKDPNAPKRAKLRAKLDAIGVERLADARDKDAGKLSRASWLAAAQAHDEAEADLEAQLRALPAPKDVIDPDVVVDGWEHLTLAEKRRIIETCVESVVIKPATRRGGNWFDESRVIVNWRRR